MAVPIPNLTFATPSSATASGALNPVFNVGSGSASGGPSTLVWVAGLALAALYLMRRK